MHAELAELSLSAQMLHFISQPTFIYIMILCGIYGVFIELIHPGFMIPGCIGAISIFIAIFSLQFIPISYVSLGFIGLGIALVISEGFLPTYGILGALGTAAFIFGSLFLVPNGGMHISWYVVVLMALTNLIIFLVLASIASAAQKQKQQNGLITLVGAEGRTLKDIRDEGQAVIRGEIWQVRVKSPLPANTPITVIHTTGLILEVEQSKSEGA